MRVTVVCLILTILSVPSTNGAAQAVPRDDYYRYVPSMPRLVSQTAASERVGLYGDASS
jgi:hypothetical protein